ncbi:MAG: molecular chaperone DnaJ [Clostridiales bacterium]|nr:molecular chaperone DnaJ [Clostridiales bacterium]
MAENKRDYYEVLGLSKNADANDIKKAYRTLAKKYHPDMNPGDKEAEQKFKEINEAYAVLSDPDRKAKYDQFGHSAFEPGGMGGFGFEGFDFSDIFSGDIFSTFFGGGTTRRDGPVRGDDVYAKIVISFEEAAFGCKKEITYNRVERCGECGGSGAAKGTAPETCQTCRGSGQVRTQQRTPFGLFQSTRACDTCHGKGKTIKSPCSNCRATGYVKVSKKLEVSIPAGIDDEQRIALRSEGNDGKNGGPKGDLIITVIVRPHPIFERNGYNLYCEIPITFAEAALGAEIEIPTLEGNIKHTIPEGTQTGTTFVLKGKGIQMVNARGKGDLHITVNVEVPRGLNQQQKDLIRAFAESCGKSNHTKRESFFGRIFGKDK